MAEDFENLDGNLEEENDLIDLVDEDGETKTFEVMGTFDLDGNHYLAVSDPIGEEEPESVEIFILKTVQDENGEDTYVTVEDEESDAAFEYFLTLVEAEDGEE